MAASRITEPRFSIATVALIVAGLLVVVAVGYRVFVSSDPDATSNAATATTNAQEPPSLATAIAALQQRLREDPDNHELWFRLGLLQRDDMQFRPAEQSFRRAMELAPQNPDYVAYLGEMLLIQATRANRPAPPEAEQLFRRALQLQPGNPQSRFYLATLKDQAGDHRGAIDDMIALLRDAPAGELWPQQVRESVIAIARQHNINIEGRLPPAPTPQQSAATRGIPGPTPQQMQEARNIPPGEQQRMVQGMVERLAARLRQNPRDEQGWMMLMRSYMVQRQPDQAREALRSALAAFANDQAAQGRLRTAAQQLNVPNPA